MKLVLDTHVWVFYVTGMYEKLSKPAHTALTQAEALHVSTISCWEVALLVKRGRLGIDNVGQWLQDALQFPRIRLINLSPQILTRSVFLENFHADPADRMIVATSEIESIPLVSADQKIRQLKAIETIW